MSSEHGSCEEVVLDASPFSVTSEEELMINQALEELRNEPIPELLPEDQPESEGEVPPPVFPDAIVDVKTEPVDDPIIVISSDESDTLSSLDEMMPIVISSDEEVVQGESLMPPSFVNKRKRKAETPAYRLHELEPRRLRFEEPAYEADVEDEALSLPSPSQVDERMLWESYSPASPMSPVQEEEEPLAEPLTRDAETQTTMQDNFNSVPWNRTDMEELPGVEFPHIFVQEVQMCWACDNYASLVADCGLCGRIVSCALHQYRRTSWLDTQSCPSCSMHLLKPSTWKTLYKYYHREE